MSRSHAALLGAIGITTLVLGGCGSGSKPAASATSGSAHENESSPYGSSEGASSSATEGAASSAPSATATVVTVKHNGRLGTILAAGPQRLTVYMFVADKGSTSTCSGACAQVWPPVITSSSATAQGGAIVADLGTITRSDGTKQVTYKGHPLYYYAADKGSSSAYGQALSSFGAPWYVITPSGSEVQ
jgi:predicted lipoprotein with Yx(FWY)xxD motif